MTSRPDVYPSLDLALGIGGLLLSSGAGAIDVEATMLAVAKACGLDGVSADVTFTKLTLQHQPSLEVPASILVRRLQRRTVNYEELILVDDLVRELVDKAIDPAEARERLARIASWGHRRPQWLSTICWGLMGAALAVTLGGGPVVCGLALVSACGIDLLSRTMRRVPQFYERAAGGLFATLVATTAAAASLNVDLSLVVSAAIILLLSGIGLMGAMEDALTGYPLTASARLLEALLVTTGLIAGVAAGLAFAGAVGADLGHVDPGAVSFTHASAMSLGAAAAAAAFTYASYGPRRAAVAAAFVGGAGQVVFLLVDRLALGSTWSSAAAAVTIGGLSHGVAGRVRVPALVLIVPAIVPLLPGLAIYRGLALLAEGEDGVLSLAAASATAVALAAGVLLGQYLVQPIRRGRRRLDHRSFRPRLVGPLRFHNLEGRASQASDSPRPPAPRSERREGLHRHLSRFHHHAGRLGYLAPGAHQVTQGLGDHEPGVVREALQHRTVGIVGPQCRHVVAVKQGSRATFARVPEGPGRRTVRRGYGHLDRVFDARPSTDVLDEPDGRGHRLRRILCQPEGQRQEEEDFRVRRPLDLGVEVGGDLQDQVSLHPREVGNHSVVHPQPPVVAERMTVRLLHRSARGRPDVGEHAAGPGVCRELMEVAVVPCGLGAAEHTGCLALAVPAHTEAVTVRRRRTELGVLALHDERVLGLVEQFFEVHRRAGVRQPTAHGVD